MMQLEDSNYYQYSEPTEFFREPLYHVYSKPTQPRVCSFPGHSRCSLYGQSIKNQWKTIKACLPATPATSEAITNSFGRGVSWAPHACRETYFKWALKRPGKRRFPCVAGISGVLGTMPPADTMVSRWHQHAFLEKTRPYKEQVATHIK